MIYYLNKKGNLVELAIRRHAVFAFQERFERLFNVPISGPLAEQFIVARFPLAQRVKNISHKEKCRTRRHGHSIYFRDPDFTYVVHNAVIITVEISRKDKRGLN